MADVLQCSSCGGSNQLPEGKNSMFCAFCGGTIEKKDNQKVNESKPEKNPQIKNYLELAKNAEESNNYQEAINYYNKAIEFNLKLPEAWFGKGHCSGWSGNLRIIKINEMVNNFKKALEYSNEENKGAMAKRIAKSIDGCSFAVYKLSYNHTVEFATVDGTYSEHLHRSINILNALEYAHSSDPSSKHILDTIVKISENLLTPISYKDYDGNYSSHGMDGSSQDKVNKIRIKYSTQLALLNPSYASEIKGKVQTGNIMFYIGIGGSLLAFILYKTNNIFYGVITIIISIIVGFIGYRKKSDYEGILQRINNIKSKTDTNKSKEKKTDITSHSSKQAKQVVTNIKTGQPDKQKKIFIYYLISGAILIVFIIMFFVFPNVRDKEAGIQNNTIPPVYNNVSNQSNDTKEEGFKNSENNFSIYYEVYNTYKDKRDPYLNLRSLANSNSKIVEKLSDGTHLKLLDINYGIKGEWMKVKVISSGKIGYAHSKWIRRYYE